ncbi:hypothetical protein AB4Z50_35020 [Paenibacillus sp. 2TAB26]|uniref:hypothetical protein n=1 Tax=Paenibacillus sp. 2TAB26 TaxID=3233005 RepID=UPI003F99CBE0
MIDLYRSILKAKYVWFLVLPGMIYYLVFAYIPLYGIQIAFRDYTFIHGIWGSEWVGLQYFSELFQ